MVTFVAAVGQMAVSILFGTVVLTTLGTKRSYDGERDQNAGRATR